MVRINDNESLSFSYDELLTCKEQVTVGEDYYVFNQIVVGLTVINYEEVTLSSVTDDEDYPFEADGTAYSYAVHVPKKELRFMNIAEIERYWMDHRTEIITYSHSNKAYQKAMITCINRDFICDALPPICLGHEWVTLSEFLTYCTKEDGSRFMIEEED